MSHNTGNFVHELVIMAKAMEELPLVQASLTESRRQVSEQSVTIQQLELRLIDLKNELDAAHAATRTMEAQRDDAEMRFLEADDKVSSFTRLIKDQAKAFGLLLEAVEPTAKPEPVSTGPDLTKIEEHKFDDGGPYNEPTTQPAGQHWSAEDEANHQRAVDPTPVTADGGDGTSERSEQSLPPQEVNELEEWAARPLDPELPVPGYPTEGVSVPADPTVPNVDVMSGATPTTDAPNTTSPTTSDEDDVGYHNEPLISTEPGGWQAWDSWCTRMNRRYGGGSWPARPATA